MEVLSWMSLLPLLLHSEVHAHCGTSRNGAKFGNHSENEKEKKWKRAESEIMWLRWKEERKLEEGDSR